MPPLSGLRSPYEEVSGLLGFGRTLDKIRLHAEGKLPEDYLPMLGMPNPYTLDGKSCRLLGITYEELIAEVLKGGSDEEVLAWAFTHGRKPSDLEIEVSNAFSMKLGWRDETTPYLRKMVAEAGFPVDEVLTFADYIDRDEGRSPRFGPDPSVPAGEVKATAIIPGLRSPYEKVGGLVHFGRMIDKIRLHRSGALPDAWAGSKGVPASFDGATCRFLGLDYAALEAEVLSADKSDEDLLAWAFATGRHPSKLEMMAWNPYLSKRGWRDRFAERVEIRLKESHMPNHAALTMFDYIDLDEGRPSRF